jgi:hypothetical protein
MTLKYLGIHPESMYTGKKYERHLHHTETIRGKIVCYYEVIEMEDVNVNVAMSAVKRVNELNFAV